MSLCNHFFQTSAIYFQEYLKFLMKYKCKLMSLIIRFSQNIFKNKSKRGKNLVSFSRRKNKRIDERIDLLILTRVNIYSNNNGNFSERKMKQFGNPPFLTELPPPSSPVQLTPISEQFFHDLFLCLNLENKNPPSNFRGGNYARILCMGLKSYVYVIYLCNVFIFISVSQRYVKCRTTQTRM